MPGWHVLPATCVRPSHLWPDAPPDSQNQTGAAGGPCTELAGGRRRPGAAPATLGCLHERAVHSRTVPHPFHTHGRRAAPHSRPPHEVARRPPASSVGGYRVTWGCSVSAREHPLYCLLSRCGGAAVDPHRNEDHGTKVLCRQGLAPAWPARHSLRARVDVYEELKSTVSSDRLPFYPCPPAASSALWGQGGAGPPARGPEHQTPAPAAPALQAARGSSLGQTGAGGPMEPTSSSPSRAFPTVRIQALAQALSGRGTAWPPARADRTGGDRPAPTGRRALMPKGAKDASPREPTVHPVVPETRSPRASGPSQDLPGGRPTPSFLINSVWGRHRASSVESEQGGIFQAVTLGQRPTGSNAVGEGAAGLRAAGAKVLR